jgi:threonine 3-dehydrogenase
LEDIADRITFVRGDLSVWSEVFNVVKDHEITHIYHMGAMLTFESEANPWGSFHTNVVGTYNMLEAARLLGVKQMMFTSSIGTFDASLVPELSDTVLQRPRDFYGVGKLYCEGLGRMYRKKFGLDFRALRYPSVVGPGVNTPGHWDAPMIQNAILGKPAQCNSSPERGGAIIYYKDAALAADRLLQAPAEKIRMINYNVGGIKRVTPREMERALKNNLPEVTVNYAAVPGKGIPMREIAWDDSYARSEWGWSPEYSDIERLVSDFIQETKNNPRRHGLK